jgi:hypothetical protein
MAHAYVVFENRLIMCSEPLFLTSVSAAREGTNVHHSSAATSAHTNACVALHLYIRPFVS